MSETLLIVDDVAMNLLVLGEVLRGEGYHVKIANSGPLALQHAVEEPRPDLILLDVMMPDMDGHEVLARLRADERTRDIPVIFVTAMDSVEAETQGLQSGAADYLSKPIVAPLVLARVRTQLELKRARDWLRDQNAFLEAEVNRRLAEIDVIRDESERAQARLEHQLELILSSAAEGIFGVDVEGVINFVNPSTASMLGYDAPELLGSPVESVLAVPAGQADADQAPPDALQDAIRAGLMLRDHEDIFRRKDGVELPVECSCMPIEENEQLLGSVVTWQDISERRSYLEQLERKSNFDDLTGLPNRNLLSDRLARAIEGNRGSERLLAVFSLNLDRFKGVNDSLGRDAGDHALCTMAQRLTQLLSPTDTLARVEGDEFILVAVLKELEAVTRYAQAIHETLRQPILIEGRQVVLSSSVGIAVHPRDGETSTELLRNAAAAMFKAKGEGGQRFRYYTPAMNARALERLDLENGLREAIESDGLMLYYQPQIDLRGGHIIGAEALIRWHDPQRGWVSPAELISVAEESGLIVPLGEWVLREACRQNRAWQDAGLRPMTVAVNLSARQLASCDIVALADMILRETGLAPELLELELTESAAMTDIPAFIKATRRLKERSISLSIDDFGTGFSSLSYLRRFDIDRLKIDRSFVNDIVHDPGSASIVTAIIALAHSLNLAALAEGVETEEQLHFLRARDCDEMQGFYFSRPLPAVELAELLRSSRQLEIQDASPWRGRSLLLVDDDPQILFALKRLLDVDGYQIHVAHDGHEALDLMAKHDIRVVISDVWMPRMDGTELFSRIRTLHPQAVRILLTGLADLELVVRAVNRGDVFRLLTKPWQESELRAAVSDAFRVAHSRALRQEVRVAGSEPFHAHMC